MGKKSKFINIVCTFILAQPIFDVLIYVLRDSFEIDSILISFIRPLFAVFIYLYLLISNKINKKIKILSFVYLFIFAVYSIFHIINIKNYFFSGSEGAMLDELRYLFNYGYYILQLINFYTIFKFINDSEKNKILKFFVIGVSIMCLLYFLSMIISPELTYPYNLMKLGYKGWSVSSHYYGHATLFSLPIIIYSLFEKKLFNKWYKYFILILTIIPGFYFVGTKTPLIGILIIFIAYSLFYLVGILFKKKKFCLDFSAILLITVILVSTFKFSYGYNNLVVQTGAYEDTETVQRQINKYKYDISTDNEFEKKLGAAINSIDTEEFSAFDSRQIQLKINEEVRKLSPLKDKLFGYGYHNMLNCLWVENDTFGIYYSFGLIGFILIVLIPFFMVGLSGIWCLLDYKRMNIGKLLLGLGVCLSIGVVTVTGYTLMFAQTVFYLIFILILSNDVFTKIEYSKKRKYLFMTNDLNVGGAEVGLVDVINELSKTETVDLVLLRKEGSLLERINSNVNVYEILNKKYSSIKRKIYHLLYFMGGIFTKYVYSKTIDTEYEAEIAYLEGYPAVFISSSTNPNSIKVASIRVGLKRHKLSGEKIPFGKLIIKNAYKKIDKIWGVSKETTNEFVEKYPFCKHKTSTIYTYFNVEEIKNKSKLNKNKLFESNKINFLAVGRFNHQKGYDRLIDSFEIVHRKNKKTMLHIIGKNDTEIGEEIKKKIQDKGLDNAVKLYGVIDNPYPYILKCDAFISGSYYEGYPRVINEALALKKICIGPKVTGMDEALDNGRLGILVEDTIDGLVKGMEEFINNKNLVNSCLEEINKFDGNKSHFFESFKILVNKKKSMIIYFPKLSYGGMEKSLINLINNCHLADKYDLTLYLIYKGKNNYLSLLPNNMKVIVSSYGNWNLINKFISIVKILYRYIYSVVNKYDISISYSYQHPILTSLTRLSSKNNIIYIHSNLVNGVDKKIVNRRLKKCKYERFNKIICVSNDSKETLTKLINRNKNIYVINNPIDGDEIVEKALEEIEDFKFEKNKTYFINICRQEENVKKLSRIIEATKKLVEEKFDFEVIFIGDGKDHEYYKQMTKNNKLNNIHIIGSKTNPYKYLKKSSALVLSSVREGYPVVFNEAKTLGIPIVTTNVSDAKKDIENKYGIVVDNIYEGMKQFLLNGYKMNKKFDYKKFNKEVEKETDELLN